ncbi:MAG TPA: hypothetical protein VMI93_14305 [Candidatus Solibacter sp.]|nr:hypothetical protein [Candidatus Solibacter sp.]
MIRFASVVALGLFLGASIAGAPPRVACCHGCEMYTCSDDQCGKTCKLGPKCKSCWKKDCTNHQ